MLKDNCLIGSPYYLGSKIKCVVCTCTCVVSAFDNSFVGLCRPLGLKKKKNTLKVVNNFTQLFFRLGPIYVDLKNLHVHFVS